MLKSVSERGGGTLRRLRVKLGPCLLVAAREQFFSNVLISSSDVADGQAVLAGYY